jgi:hypothetical protein
MGASTVAGETFGNILTKVTRRSPARNCGTKGQRKTPAQYYPSPELAAA